MDSLFFKKIIMYSMVFCLPVDFMFAMQDKSEELVVNVSYSVFNALLDNIYGPHRKEESLVLSYIEQMQAAKNDEDTHVPMTSPSSVVDVRSVIEFSQDIYSNYEEQDACNIDTNKLEDTLDVKQTSSVMNVLKYPKKTKHRKHKKETVHHEPKIGGDVTCVDTLGSAVKSLVELPQDMSFDHNDDHKLNIDKDSLKDKLDVHPAPVMTRVSKYAKKNQKRKQKKESLHDELAVDNDMAYLETLIEQNLQSSTPAQTIKKQESQEQVSIHNLGGIINTNLQQMSGYISMYGMNDKQKIDSIGIEYWGEDGFPYVFDAITDYVKLVKEHNVQIPLYIDSLGIEKNLQNYHRALIQLPASLDRESELYFVDLMYKEIRSILNSGDTFAYTKETLHPYLKELITTMNHYIDEQLRSTQVIDGSQYIWEEDGKPCMYVLLTLYVKAQGVIEQEMIDAIEAYQLKTVRHKAHWAKDKFSVQYQKAERYNHFACQMVRLVKQS